MARLLMEHTEWFTQIEPNTMGEGDFERDIAIHAPDVYPEYHVLPFKQNVQYNGQTAKPDLVFIAKDYSEWRVVEIEMGYHSFNSHIEPQITILSNGDYNKSHSDYLIRKYPYLLNSIILEKLIINTPPKILLIVNEPKFDWKRNLLRYRTDLAIFELFKSHDGKEVYRVNGEYPTLLKKPSTTCSLHPITKRVLIVDDPIEISLPKEKIINILYNNCLTQWERIDNSANVFLQPKNRNPLGLCEKYDLFEQGNGYLVLQEKH